MKRIKVKLRGTYVICTIVLLVFVYQWLYLLGDAFETLNMPTAARSTYKLSYSINHNGYSLEKLISDSNTQDKINYTEQLLSDTSYLQSKGENYSKELRLQYAIRLYQGDQKLKAKEYFRKNKPGFVENEGTYFAYIILHSKNSNNDDYKYALQECLGLPISKVDAKQLNGDNAGVAGMLYGKLGDKRSEEVCREYFTKRSKAH